MSVRTSAELAVVVFGDGSLPFRVDSCFQFRLVADLAVRGEGSGHHLGQLAEHIDRAGCRDCRAYLGGRIRELAHRDQLLNGDRGTGPGRGGDPTARS